MTILLYYIIIMGNAYGKKSAAWSSITSAPREATAFVAKERRKNAGSTERSSPPNVRFSLPMPHSVRCPIRERGVGEGKWSRKNSFLFFFLGGGG